MNNDMKRRTFLTATIGTLVAAPLLVRYFSGKRKGLPHQNFARELDRYQKKLDLPISPVDGPATFTLPFRPQAGSEWNYVLFSTSILPNEMSQAVAGEPDAYLIREGWIGVSKTQSDQIVVHGGDETSKVCSPRWTDPRDPAEFSLLVQDGKLVPAKEKGTKATEKRDTQFENILSLASLPQGELSAGRKWKGESGRVKPFRYATNYEIVGFAEIDHRKTVQVRFDATIPNLAQGVTKIKLEKNQSLTNRHSGHAWFELESGLLVRQELDMTSTCTNVRDKDLTVQSKFIVQLFTV